MKLCSKCKKPGEFSKHAKSRDGLQSRCKECFRVYNRRRYERDREHIKERVNAHRAANLERYRARDKIYWSLPESQAKKKATKRRAYSGWTHDAFEAAWTAQGGLCAICQIEMAREGTKVTSVAADHCHRTMKQRGLLCRMCNSGLGQFKDSPEYLRAAVEYLISHTVT